MDLLESGDEREIRPLGDRLRGLVRARVPGAAVAAVAAVVTVALVAGVVGAVQVSQSQAREAARVVVDLQAAGAASTTVRGVARGSLELRLVNRRANRAQLGDLVVAVEGLRVLQVDGDLSSALGALEERFVRVVYAVPDCARLVLPGRLSLSVRGQAQPAQRLELPVYDPRGQTRALDGVPLAACPQVESLGRRAATLDVAARPAGGGSRPQGLGAEGVLRLEVRNAGEPLRLLRLTGEVPGVRFRPVVLDGGRTIETDGLIIVRLPFTIDDCEDLQPAGRLVLSIERFRAVQEVGLRAIPEPEAGVGPQVSLRVLFDACD